LSVTVSFTIQGANEAFRFKELIRKTATEKGLSMSELIVEAVAEYLRKQNGNT